MDQTFDEVVLGTVLLFLSPCSEENKGTETKGPSPWPLAKPDYVSSLVKCLIHLPLRTRRKTGSPLKI